MDLAVPHESSSNVSLISDLSLKSCVLTLLRTVPSTLTVSGQRATRKMALCRPSAKAALVRMSRTDRQVVVHQRSFIKISSGLVFFLHKFQTS